MYIYLYICISFFQYIDINLSLRIVTSDKCYFISLPIKFYSHLLKPNMIFLSVHARAKIVHGKLQRFPPISVRPEYVTQSAYANECSSVCVSHSLCPSVLHMQWSWVSPPACGRISMRCSVDTCGTEAAPPAPAPPKHPLPSHTHTYTHTLRSRLRIRNARIEIAF